MQPTTVSHAYTLGVREGRALFTSLIREGYTRADIRRLAPDLAENAAVSLRAGFAGDVRDALRGERDFWLSQAGPRACDKLSQA